MCIRDRVGDIYQCILLREFLAIIIPSWAAPSKPATRVIINDGKYIRIGAAKNARGRRIGRGERGRLVIQHDGVTQLLMRYIMCHIRRWDGSSQCFRPHPGEQLAHAWSAGCGGGICREEIQRVSNITAHMIYVIFLNIYVSVCRSIINV